VVEILQNCIIFHDRAHDMVTGKDNRENRQLLLQHGEPMLFGKNQEKGLVLDGLKLKVVTVGENGVTKDDILVHDAHEPDRTLHLLLAQMSPPDFPMALGIIRSVAEPTYDKMVYQQVEQVQENRKISNIDELLHSGNTWEVE